MRNLYKQSQKYWSLQLFKNLRNFETGRDTPENHRIKSLDFYEIYQSDWFFLPYLVFFQVTEVWKN